MTSLRLLGALALGTAVLTACAGDPTAPRPMAAMAARDGLGSMSQKCSMPRGEAAARILPTTSGASVLVAAPGNVVAQVHVRAGASCWSTPEGASGTHTIAIGSAACWVVTGLGTATATVQRTGSTPTCKPVSSIQFGTAPLPDDGGGDGDGDGEGDGDGDGDGDGGDGGGTGPGSLVVCAAVTRPINNETYFNLSIGTAEAELTSTIALEGTCTAPMELPSGEYLVSERPDAIAPIQAISSDPADRILASSVTQGTATVRVVAGTTTTITFLNAAP